MVILMALGLAIVAFRGVSSREGNYPRSRIATVVIIMFALFLLAFGLVIFSRGILLIVWLTYLIIAIALATMAILELRSSNPTTDNDQT